MSDQGYYVSEAEQIRLLRARLETAEGLLREALNLFIGTRQNLSPRELDWLVRSSFAGQGKEPITTGSSLEPTDRAQSGAAPHDPVPGALQPGQRCTACDGDQHGHQFFEVAEKMWHDSATGNKFRCPYVEPARLPLEPPCGTCGGAGEIVNGLDMRSSFPCPRCRPPEVPTCKAWCGTEGKRDLRVDFKAWHKAGDRNDYCEKECADHGHPRHPAPREGER